MVRWSDTFWGEGNRGFEVLSTNVKNGAIAIEEFQRFLNENSQYESAYCKNLSRLQAQLLKVQHVGTFTPIWQSIRDLLEKIALAHSSTVTYYQDLLREIHNYHDLYQKKVKTSIQKDSDITRTADLVSQLNNALNTLNKAKEQYHSIGLDYERAKRSGNNLTNGTSTPTPQDTTTSSSSLAQTAFNTLTSTTRQFERLEKKYRQAHDDYKASVEKYNSIRTEFEKRFYEACTKFQDFEAEHVDKMLNFSLNYAEILKRNNEQTRLAQNEFQERIKQFTGTDLIESFVEQKKTGVERPAPIQFEELDNIKSSLNLSSSVTPDSAAGLSDELITFEQSEASVPAFQAHFPVSSPTMLSGWPSTTNIKKSESNRALASNANINHQHVAVNNQSTTSLGNTTPMSLSNPNNPLSRLQENSNESSSNPFNVKIPRPAFKGFWPSNRKDKKGDKKKSNNSKSTKNDPVQPPPVPDETSSINSANESNGFHKMMGSMEGLNDIPSSITKNKCPTPEPYTQSSPSISSSGINRPGCQSTIPFSSTAMRKSTSSSDSSDDDDDDFRFSKIQFKINPSTQKSPIAEESDDAKISDAMLRMNKNIGQPATASRAGGRDEKMPDMSKSLSIGHIGSRIPPPLPSRPTSTLSTSITTDNLRPLPSSPPSTSLTNTFDGFEPRSQSMSMSSNHQENIPPVLAHPRSMTTTSTTESKKLTSISSTDDDTEVANTFPGDSSINKAAPFTIPRPPRLRQTPSHQPVMGSTGPSIANGRMTPFIAPNTPHFSNSLMTSMDQRMSPLTIGATDQIPIAVAFQETIHVMMSSDDQTKWKIRILGDMLVSFPAAILNLLVDQSPHLNALEFRLQNLNKVENVIANPQLVSQKSSTPDSEGPIYTFNMAALSNILRNLQEKNRSLPFFNFGILKYEVKHSGTSNIPIQVTSQWTRTFDTITVNINYRFNSSALPESIRLVNDMVTFYTNIPDGQQATQSSPTCEWCSNEHKLSWKVPYIFDGSGTLSATLMTNQSASDGNDSDQQPKPLTTSSAVHVQFLAENALFSSIGFEFACRGYRVSLLKKKIASGKYQSEPDQSEPLQFFKRPSTDQSRMSLSTPLVA